MAAIVSSKMPMYTDAVNNNNKFYEATLYNDESCQFRWGRVEDAAHHTGGQKKVYLGIGLHGMEQKLSEKKKKGYKELAVIGRSDSSTAKAITKNELIAAAKAELAGQDLVLTSLVLRLAEVNRHQLMAASGGSLNLDLSTGIVTTSLGVVISKDSITEARLLLNKFSGFVKKHDFDNINFIAALNDYLMLVPQKVGRSQGWHRDFIASTTALMQQNALLDQLASSLDLVTQRIESAEKMKLAGATKANIFDVKLRLVDDSATIKNIEKFFKEGVNHAHTSKHLKPVNIYEIEVGNMRRAFEKDGALIGNTMRLWHGTRAHNVLSIFKHGLIIPPSTGSYQITGRMFGDGLYFSDQSTKSLNYSHGFWDGQAKDDLCFMFLADVAMGKSYTPNSPSDRLPSPGSDSTFAKAEKSGVKNNEMIVYRTSQADLRYLVEFRG